MQQHKGTFNCMSSSWIIHSCTYDCLPKEPPSVSVELTDSVGRQLIFHRLLHYFHDLHNVCAHHVQIHDIIYLM